jgi:hypothetical protein
MKHMQGKISWDNLLPTFLWYDTDLVENEKIKEAHRYTDDPLPSNDSEDRETHRQLGDLISLINESGKQTHRETLGDLITYTRILWKTNRLLWYDTDCTENPKIGG